MTDYTRLIDKLQSQDADYSIDWDKWGVTAYPRSVTFGDQRWNFRPDGSTDTGFSFGDLNDMCAED